MSIPSAGRFSLLFLLLISIPSAFVGNRAMAQTTTANRDAALNFFGQFTGTTSGNGVTDRPSDSAGGLASFRQSFKPWLGYEVNYSYTRFFENYTVLPFTVQNNVHEATGAYLFEAPKFWDLRPFAAVGTGILLFLPTTTGGQRYNMQYRTPLLFEVGVNYPLSSHFGARAEYRGLNYSAPNYNQETLTTGARRLTSEPTVGLYLRF